MAASSTPAETNNRRKNVVVVGGGISGLTMAERLTAVNEDLQVTVLERENSPGGLARTFSRDGFTFDIGPHRFHTSDQEVRGYLLSILGDDYVTIRRCSNVFMAGRYRSWPLTLKSVMGLPLPVLLRSFRDLFRSRRRRAQKTFADHVISRYGRNIYDYFFKAYTEKFTGCSPEELHIDWAEAGVNRAVIDKNVKADNLFSLIKGVLIPRPVQTDFYYPSSGGIQTFCSRQAELIESRGGKVLYNSPAAGVRVENSRVTGVETPGGGTLPADRVYWSAPLSILYPKRGFRFMNSLICNIGLSRKQDNDYQWCYFGQRDIIFSRLTVPANFRRDTVPEGRDSLTVEITVNDRNWREDLESIRGKMLRDLEMVRAIRPSDVLFMDWKMIPETYPLYDLDYRERLKDLEIPEGLRLMGRCGSFWYNNMDHSIEQALAFASGKPHSKDFWKQQ